MRVIIGRKPWRKASPRGFVEQPPDGLAIVEPIGKRDELGGERLAAAASAPGVGREDALPHVGAGSRPAASCRASPRPAQCRPSAPTARATDGHQRAGGQLRQVADGGQQCDRAPRRDPASTHRPARRAPRRTWPRVARRRARRDSIRNHGRPSNRSARASPGPASCRPPSDGRRRTAACRRPPAAATIARLVLPVSMTSACGDDERRAARGSMLDDGVDRRGQHDDVSASPIALERLAVDRPCGPRGPASAACAASAIDPPISPSPTIASRGCVSGTHTCAQPRRATGSRQMLRPIAGAMIRSSAISRSNCAGNIDCAPSLSA